ncbi:unnamed protein product [Arabis nemorensis]|uniref:Cytochrome P450 n=1 Tax=Arabis nemorensis TaxID=586526 RepID=A0A565BU79_9BRAS|nr:unnamed protein product [Arabis nemorensis]
MGNEFDEFLKRVVQDHADGGRDGNDFIDVLLTIERVKSAEFEIDRISIKAIILNVFVGGTETSYTLMEWAMTASTSPRVSEQTPERSLNQVYQKTILLLWC